MHRNTPEAMEVTQRELLSGEAVLWTGQPDPRVVFHREDAGLVPFSLLWGGFAIFWELGVMGLGPFGTQRGQPWIFGILWGIPFVLMGQYFIWGRFFYARWKKARVYYAVTNLRVIAIQKAPSHKVASAYIDTLPTIGKAIRTDGIGTVKFAPEEPLWARRRGLGTWDRLDFGLFPEFVDINDAEEVCRLVANLREKSRKNR
jgi:hypothetical protein